MSLPSSPLMCVSKYVQIKIYLKNNKRENNLPRDGEGVLALVFLFCCKALVGLIPGNVALRLCRP